MFTFELEKKIQRLRMEILQSNQTLLTISQSDAKSLLEKIERLEHTIQELLRSVCDRAKKANDTAF